MKGYRSGRCSVWHCFTRLFIFLMFLVICPLSVRAQPSLEELLWQIDSSNPDGEGGISPQERGRGYVPPPFEVSHLNKVGRPVLGETDLPERFDWRESGVVTTVQDQGDCGACYAFATLGSFESRLLIADEGAYDFSENHAAACVYEQVVGDPNRGGCDGGNIWMLTNLYSGYGTVQEACDPWDPADQICRAGGCPVIKTVTDMWVLYGNETPPTTALKDWLQNYGPLYVAMDSGYSSWEWAKEFGDYDGSYTLHCPMDSPQYDHAVLLVGWDDTLSHDGGMGGWIVKNSWGTDWGGTAGYGTEGGHFTIAYGSAGLGAFAAFMPGWQDYDSDGNLLYHDEGGHQTAFGAGSGSTEAWGLARFTPSLDGQVTRVEIWTTDRTVGVDVYIYDAFDGFAPSRLLWQGLNHSFDYAGYHSIEIPSGLYVTAGDDVNVVVKFENDSYIFPVSADDLGPAYVDESFFSADGADRSWTDLGSEWSADVGIRLRIKAPAVPTSTPTPTTINTPTATNTPTNTFTPTVTNTPPPTETSTPTATGTDVPASYHLALPLVLKDVNMSPLSTVTLTSTPSPEL